MRPRAQLLAVVLEAGLSLASCPIEPQLVANHPHHHFKLRPLGHLEEVLLVLLLVPHLQQDATILLAGQGLALLRHACRSSKLAQVFDGHVVHRVDGVRRGQNDDVVGVFVNAWADNSAGVVVAPLGPELSLFTNGVDCRGLRNILDRVRELQRSVPRRWLRCRHFRAVFLYKHRHAADHVGQVAPRCLDPAIADVSTHDQGAPGCVLLGLGVHVLAKAVFDARTRVLELAVIHEEVALARRKYLPQHLVRDVWKVVARIVI
mmetsp:Transcript_84274/g.272779  ORF Transcript_84274/g.272779 Transcript_84274/m.272779 type:complete len:262 (+) Transcript_84274:248-1033(+)